MQNCIYIIGQSINIIDYLLANSAGNGAYWLIMTDDKDKLRFPTFNDTYHQILIKYYTKLYGKHKDYEIIITVTRHIINDNINHIIWQI